VARQRFIWPDIWSDPNFAKLSSDGKVLYIGLFSNADDEGRIMADPAYLKSVIWPLENGKDWQSVAKAVQEVVKTMHCVGTYSVRGVPLIQLRNWHKWQTPKYPQPSKLPAPRRFISHVIGPNDSGKYSWNRSGNDSVNVPGTFPERSPTGRVGQGRDKKSCKRSKGNSAASVGINNLNTAVEIALQRLFSEIDEPAKQMSSLRSWLETQQVSAQLIDEAREALVKKKAKAAIKNACGYVIETVKAKSKQASEEDGEDDIPF